MSDRIKSMLGAGLCAAAALWLSGCQSNAFKTALGAGSSTARSANLSAPSSSSVSSAASVSSAPSLASASSGNDDPCANQPRKDPSVVGSESWNQGNNSPFSARTDPEPTACDIARENGHKWTRLVGYTPAEATKRAKAAGWEGKIVVHEMQTFDPKCKDGMVCSLDPALWELNQAHELTLMINRKVEISTPD